MNILQFIEEKPRKIPVVGEYDVIVCGGGTAGFPAAVAAARQGAKVALIERYGFLGGVPAYCIMPAWHNIDGYHTKLLEEFAGRVANMGPGPNPLVNRHAEPEYVKQAALEMVVESGVELHLHTMVVEVLKEGSTVNGIITESKSGRRAFIGKTIIDATGDGDIAYLAGAEYMKGNDEGITQGMTVRFRIGSIDFDRYLAWAGENRQFFGNISDEALEDIKERARGGLDFYMGADLSELYKLHNSDGKLPVLSYFNGSSIRKNELSVNATRVYELDGTKEEDLTTAEVSCRLQEFALWNFLRRNIPGFENSVIIETAAQIGVRETRRITGDYILTEEDCRNTVEFEDTIARNPVAFDLHDKKYSCEILNKSASIPYRTLLPKGLEGILVAGRCVSTDHVANASVRRMHTAFDLGQVAGIAAALAVCKGITPRGLCFEELKEVLLANGAIVV